MKARTLTPCVSGPVRFSLAEREPCESKLGSPWMLGTKKRQPWKLAVA